uniref:Uncharacterized protein n=1 Tax=Lepeophtheirus salmonis TaxID=72036 RepID=A0A0K2UN64_LEPSM
MDTIYIQFPRTHLNNSFHSFLEGI